MVHSIFLPMHFRHQQAGMAKITIVLIEDHDLTRVSLRTALQRTDLVDVVGESPTATQGLKLVRDQCPDVAVVDIGLPDMDGIELTRQIRRIQVNNPDCKTRILILTMHGHEESVLAAFAVGADSYCMKDAGLYKIVEAIQTTSEGNAWIDPSIASIVLRQVRHIAKRQPADKERKAAIEPTNEEIKKLLEKTPLTDRELEILQLIVDGRSNAEIADHLFISLGTVKTHVRSILTKLSADDRTQAAVLALRSGLAN